MATDNYPSGNFVMDKRNIEQYIHVCVWMYVYIRVCVCVCVCIVDKEKEAKMHHIIDVLYEGRQQMPEKPAFRYQWQKSGQH